MVRKYAKTLENVLTRGDGEDVTVARARASNK